MPGRFEDLDFTVPFVVRKDGVQSLHFTIGETQSRMRADRPDELQVDYTRTMMGFLLLRPEPREILMIGLGGGSMAKFCHAHLRSAHLTVVENNPGVIALRDEFAIPPDDERFRVIAGDGAAFVRESRGGVDVLLVDGFGPGGQPPSLCSQAFYDDCKRALAPGGVLVVNLHADDAGHEVHAHRIAQAFDGNALQVIATGQANCIVFAMRGEPLAIEQLRGPLWMRALSPQGQRQLKADMDHIGWNACALRTAITNTEHRSEPGLRD
jgi:spermidine synthase